MPQDRAFRVRSQHKLSAWPERAALELLPRQARHLRTLTLPLCVSGFHCCFPPGCRPAAGATGGIEHTRAGGGAGGARKSPAEAGLRLYKRACRPDQKTRTNRPKRGFADHLRGLACKPDASTASGQVGFSVGLPTQRPVCSTRGPTVRSLFRFCKPMRCVLAYFV